MEKNYSVYIHKVETEDGPMYYTGVTKDYKNRWCPSGYKTTSLWSYIEQYGWENIEHAVVFETTDRKKACEIEDMLICGYESLGRKINERRSGHICIDNERNYYNEKNKSYYHIRYKNDKEYTERRLKQGRDYMRKKRADPEYAEQSRKSNRQYLRERRKNDPEFVERCRENNKKRRATPEGRIYDRVHAFNRYHPDRAVETPMEAKLKFLESGYIPQYIKHDDIDGPAE